MSDARLLPRSSEAKTEEAIPSLSGAQLLELHNARRFPDVIARLRGQATPSEIARERAELLRRAAAKSPASSQSAKIRDLRDRLVRLSAGLPPYLDAGVVDGLCGAVLLLSPRCEAPSESTIQRALAGLQSVNGGF